MAAASDSTNTPTRRQFVTHAALSGVAATSGPIFTVPATGLAAVCAWATAHYRNMSVTARSESWDDAKLDAEMDRYGFAFRRAITEPSGSLVDIKAKAKMLLADLEEGDAASLADLDDDERLTRVVLREVIAFTGN